MLTYAPYTRFIKSFRVMLFTYISILLFPVLANAQSFIVKQRFYEGRYYLAAEDYRINKTKYFTVDMETAKQLPDTVFARQLFKYQVGTDGPTEQALETQVKASKKKFKLTILRENKPGSIYFREVKAFDRIIEREEKLLKKKKKEDEKNHIKGTYTISPVILFNEETERFNLLSAYGIYSMHQDSLNEPATPVIEYAGFMFSGMIGSSRKNTDNYLLKFELASGKTIYKSFNLKNTLFSNIAALDEIINPLYINSLSSPYLIFYGSANNSKDVHQRIILYNYETLEIVSNIRFTLDNKGSTFYLHKNILYRKYEYFSMQWQEGLDGYDLKDNGKFIYSFKVK